MSGMDVDEAIRMYHTDPKPLPRVRDPEVFRTFHRTEPRCLCCGHKGFIHAHHLLNRSQGGDDVLANLVPLCAGCHEAHHRMNTRTVRDALATYLLSERGAEALAYLRSKRSDGWIQGKFGVTLRVRGRDGEYEDV